MAEVSVHASVNAFHLQQNAQAYVPKKEMKSQVAANIRAIFNAPDQPAALTMLGATVARYEKSAPKLATWMETNLPQGLTAFALPQAHQRLLRTSNGFVHIPVNGSASTRRSKEEPKSRRSSPTKRPAYA